jgi:hypothetical protein
MNIATELENAVNYLNDYLPSEIIESAKDALETYESHMTFTTIEPTETYEHLAELADTLMFQILNDNLNIIKDYLKNNDLNYNELMGEAVIKELYH